VLLDAGKSSENIAEYLFLSCDTVTNYLKKYKSGGLEDLVSDDYQGSECRLSEVQQRKLAQHLEERLWRFLEKIVLYNRHYERCADFKAANL
jgi:transposase